jgi:hypothetical protein
MRPDGAQAVAATPFNRGVKGLRWSITGHSLAQQ